jgi:tetratricopeptide (TPR) repeat protein
VSLAGLRGVVWLLGLSTVGTHTAATPGALPTSRTRTASATGGAFDTLAKRAAEEKDAGKLDVAVATYSKALALKPAWIDGHWALATLLYDLDRWTEAREHFTRVLAARPTDGTALTLKALCDVRLRHYNLALEELQRARALDVPSPEVRSVAIFHMALLLNRAGDPDAAMEALRPFAEQNKDSPEIIVAFGLCLLRMPVMPEEVPPAKQDLVRLAGRGAYYFSRGRRTPVGRLTFDELLSRYPTEPNVHYAAGLFISSDDLEAGIQEFQRELRITPNHYPALIQMAALESRRGNIPAATAAAERAVALAPDVPGARLVLGRALLDAGETERALRELERGVSLAPENAALQFAIARAYQRVGRAEEAQQARERFLKLDTAAQETYRNSKRAAPLEIPAADTPENGGSN